MAGCGCGCGGNGVKLIFACSGAANTGYLADCSARMLMSKGFGRMTCLAALGADLSGFIESARSADENIVIDGCSIACGKKVFDKHGLDYTHYITTDFGIEKNKTVITDQIIEDISNDIMKTVKLR